MARALRTLALAAAASLLAPSARAIDTDTCVHAYEDAQKLRKQGSLRASREELLVCAQRACPEAASRDCTRWLQEVEASMPSVVVVATDDDGKEITDARVYLDREEIAKRLDGVAIAVDPGKHVLRVERRRAHVEQEVVFFEGEKNRRVAVSLAAGDGGAPSGKSNTAAWVLGGVGALSLGAFTVLGLKAKSDFDALKATCTPPCDDASVKTTAHVADAFLGVSVIALGVATYLFLASDGNETSTSSAGGFSVAASPVGGSLSFSGAF